VDQDAEAWGQMQQMVHALRPAYIWCYITF